MMRATSRPSLPHRATGIPSASPARGIFSTSTGSFSRAFSSSSCSSTTEQWRRLVPQSTLVLLQAWNTWVHYATFHLPPELNGFYGYNALQQIAYFSVVFVFGPLAILTGIAMSPARSIAFPGMRSSLAAGNRRAPFTSSRCSASLRSSSCM